MVLRTRHTEDVVCQFLLFDGYARCDCCLDGLTVMKNTTNAIEYWSEFMLRSSVMPATFAFPMLVLWLECQLLIHIRTELNMDDERPCSSRDT
jgi:hypothetical protein